MPVPEAAAMKMVHAAHDVAAAIDIFITAVVVDESGRLVALGRMDNATPVTVDLAMNKAYTAASFRQPTKDLQNVTGESWFQSLIVSSGGRITPGGGSRWYSRRASAVLGPIAASWMPPSTRRSLPTFRSRRRKAWTPLLLVNTNHW